MIKAVVFDFAGVIGSEGYWLWLAENISNLDANRDFFMDISHKVDRGDISEHEFTSLLAEKSGKPQDKIWSEIFQKIVINKNLLEFITKLRKNRYKVGLLTNFVHEWILEVLDTYKLHEYFDEIVISSKLKIAKPQPEIFHKMLKALDIRPQETIFIDDRQSNVDGAIRVGMKGFLYTTNEKLQKELQDEGIELNS